MKPKVIFRWIKGMSYQQVWDIQTNIHQNLIQSKLANRKLEFPNNSYRPQHEMIFCEHFPVYTLGKSGSIDHLLLTEEEIKTQQIEFFKINRGGDITYHGPGQITGYPILDMEDFFTDVHKYVRLLEESIILLLAEYGLQGTRLPSYTGVWLAPDNKYSVYRKICAIGVHMSRWVSMHGFAFNVNTDLSYFDKIVPCGITDSDKVVTSLANELGHSLDIQLVGERLAEIFGEVFDFELIKK